MSQKENAVPMSDYAYREAFGNDNDRLQQMYDANTQKIAMLKAELAQLEGDKSYTPMSDMDELDLQLAENRARAYDINQANAAIGRIDSRMTNRAKDALDRKKQDKLDDEAKELKLSDLNKQHRELLIKRSQAKLNSEKQVIDAQLQHIEKEIELKGGTPFKFNWEGDNQIDANKVMMDYYGSTVNTKNGRKFLDSVDSAKREQLKNNLIEIGEYEKAAEIEATATKKEKEKSAAEVKKTKQTLDAKIPAVEAVINALGAKGPNRTPDEENLFKKALSEQDSLARNYPNYVEISGGHLKKKYKD